MSKKKLVILLGVMIAVIATLVVIWGTTNTTKPAEVSSIVSSFKIIANNFENSEVSDKTDFTITSTQDYSVEEMRKKIRLTDDLKYDLTKTGVGNYLLKPTQIESGKILNINIDEIEDEPAFSWAFQTEQDFSVVRTSPSDGYDYVYLNSGIEVEFSKTPEKLEGYFEISPAVAGRYESNGKTLIFVPKQLTAGTEYNVLIKKGLKSKFGDELKEDYSFKFKTQEPSGNKLYLEAEENTVRAIGSKFIKVNSAHEFDNENFKVKIYQVNSTEEYLKVLKEPEKVDITGLSLISESEAQFVIQEANYYTKKFIMLPESLREGQYLVEISTGGGFGQTKNRSTRAGLQVTDIATYIQSFNGETLVWCNDIATNEVLQGAKVQIANETKETDENGIAKFNVSLREKQNIIVTTDNGRKYIANEYLRQEESKIFDDFYHAYLHTDREVYMPTDTIKFWGVILPKGKVSKMPKQVKLKVGEETFNLEVGTQGSFSGEYSFVNRVSGWVGFEIEIDGMTEWLASKNISEYVKPTYNLSTEYDKKYYKRGDTVTVDVNAEFFDETPASDLALNVSVSDYKKDVVTNSLGNSQVSFTPTPKEGWSWYPYSLSTSVRTIGGEEDAYSYNSVTYFPTNYMFKAEWKNNEIVLKSNEIDIKDAEGNEYEEGALAGATGIVRIIKEESIAEEDGEIYDFINKKNIKKYKYSTKRTEMEQIPFTMTGTHMISASYTETDNIDYYAEINYTLPDGFNGKTSAYLHGYNYHDRYLGNRYSFEPSEYHEYGENEKIELTVVGDTVSNGRALYTVFTDKIQESGVVTDNKFDITFSEKYIPRCAIAGVYFDGGVLYPIDYEYLYFNKNERKLDIDITTNKDSYKPGEKVKINVTAKDKNGIGRKTNLVLSIVDEAVFAIEEQYVDPLRKLYEYRYYNSVSQYVSHEQVISPMVSESGGEGEAERSVFKDTAAFISLVTNENGQASAEFIVPDNLTSWRITAVGVTKDVYAGNNKKNITVKLPFFVNQVMNLKYTASDDFVFSARAIGDGEKFTGKMIEYTSTISGDGIYRELKENKVYGETVAFNYGKLPPGEYEVYVKAKSGNDTDAIRKKVPVYHSLLEVDVTKEINLNRETLDISSLRFPVKLKFYDKNNKLYYDAVGKIYGTSWGDTTDQIVARELTSGRLNEIEGIAHEKENIKINQDYDGGIQLLPYSKADALLTAKVCALASEYVDVSSAKQFFYSILNYKKATSSDVSAAYFGLAALKEPVLNDIKWLLENDKGFEFEDKINLVLGLAFIGDFNGANEYYNKILSEKMKNEKNWMYMDVGNFDENYEITAKMSMLLAKINNPDFKATVQYVIDKKSNKYTPALDLLTYVLAYSPKKDSKGYVEYSINGEREKVTFLDKRVKVLTLGKEELESFQIYASEDVAGLAYYVGGIQDAVKDGKNEIKVEKTYSSQSKVGETGMITLNIKLPKNAPKGYYTVSDVVPSGMRYVSVVRDKEWYLTEQENQKLYFSFYNEDGEVNIQYKVRSLLPGDYIVESAVVSHYSGNMTGYSERGNVKINEI